MNGVCARLHALACSAHAHTPFSPSVSLCHPLCPPQIVWLRAAAESRLALAVQADASAAAGTSADAAVDAASAAAEEAAAASARNQALMGADSIPSDAHTLHSAAEQALASAL